MGLALGNVRAETQLASCGHSWPPKACRALKCRAARVRSACSRERQVMAAYSEVWRVQLQLGVLEVVTPAQPATGLGSALEPQCMCVVTSANEVQKARALTIKSPAPATWQLVRNLIITPSTRNVLALGALAICIASCSSSEPP